MVKTILKYIITVAILVAIVLGIFTLVKSKRTNDYVYQQIVSQRVETKIAETRNDNQIDTFVNLVNSQTNEKYDDVKSSILDGGEFSNLRIMFNNCTNMFKYYKSLTKQANQTSKDKQNEVVNLFDDLILKSNESFDSIGVLINYINNTEPINIEKNYLMKYFESFVKQYTEKINIYSEICINLSDYVMSDVYGEKNYSLKFIVNDSNAKMINYATTKLLANNSGLMEQSLKLITKYSTYTSYDQNALNGDDAILFINNYSQCSEINEFFNCEDKGTFISEKGTEGSKYYVVFKFLFV